MALSGQATTQSPQARQSFALGVWAVFFPCTHSLKRTSAGISAYSASSMGPMAKTSYGQTSKQSAFPSQRCLSTTGRHRPGGALHSSPGLCGSLAARFALSGFFGFVMASLDQTPSRLDALANLITLPPNAMANLDNLTPYSAVTLPSFTPQGASVDVICVAARFSMPPPGTRNSSILSICEEQRPPPLADIFRGSPGASSLRHEAQVAPIRLGTDIYIDGSVRAPKGDPVTEMMVGVDVGPCRAWLRVFGDRVWYRRLLGGLALSESSPFVSLPLCYERSFGGSIFDDSGRLVDWEPRNPVGQGFFTKAAQAIGQPAPNFEHPEKPIQTWDDRPPPVGFGPIARQWQPRLALAGTFDDNWTRTRTPLWPDNFDPRFYNAAASGLIATERLLGGEQVRLTGFSTEGIIEFRLPKVRIAVLRQRRHGNRRTALLGLDGVLLEPDEQTVTLYFRASLPAETAPSARDVDIVRELEPWEDLAG